ncbi:hypothetical protein RCL1_000716 [Eukaryota sp. TZLM3-RCL]
MIVTGKSKIYFFQLATQIRHVSEKVKASLYNYDTSRDICDPTLAGFCFKESGECAVLKNEKKGKKTGNKSVRYAPDPWIKKKKPTFIVENIRGTALNELKYSLFPSKFSGKKKREKISKKERLARVLLTLPNRDDVADQSKMIEDDNQHLDAYNQLSELFYIKEDEFESACNSEGSEIPESIIFDGESSDEVVESHDPIKLWQDDVAMDIGHDSSQIQSFLIDHVSLSKDTITTPTVNLISTTPIKNNVDWPLTLGSSKIDEKSIKSRQNPDPNFEKRPKTIAKRVRKQKKIQKRDLSIKKTCPIKIEEPPRPINLSIKPPQKQSPIVNRLSRTLPVNDNVIKKSLLGPYFNSSINSVPNSPSPIPEFLPKTPELEKLPLINFNSDLNSFKLKSLQGLNLSPRNPIIKNSNQIKTDFSLALFQTIRKSERRNTQR